MKTLVWVFAALLLSGCSMKMYNSMTPEQASELSSRMPTCSSEAECERKWAAARNWILSNADMKIQHITSDYIETFNGSSRNGGIIGDMSARVTKNPLGNGVYAIRIETWCSFKLGCSPGKYETEKSFIEAVNAL